jgi:hypothetical protein
MSQKYAMSVQHNSSPPVYFECKNENEYKQLTHVTNLNLKELITE